MNKEQAYIHTLMIFMKNAHQDYERDGIGIDGSKLIPKLQISLKRIATPPGPFYETSMYSMYC